MRGRVSTAFVCACVIGLTAVPTAAHASFAGRNGKIVFHTNRDAGNYEIYTVNPDGSSPTRLTTTAGNDLTPKWSPDGTKIAFVSIRDGNYEIYTMNADGTNQTRITNNPAQDVQPAWSPDGTKIAFGTTAGWQRGDLHDERRRLEPGQAHEHHNADRRLPAWSPDGTKIAFESDRTGNFEIFTMDANGANQINRTNNAAYDEYPNWTPDASQIIFDSNRNDGFFQLYWMNADGSNVVRQTNSGGNDTSGSRAPQQNLLVWTRDITGDNEIVTSTTELTFNSVDDNFPDWQPINGTYARPAGGTPLRVPLVPAYKQCTANETIHRGSWNSQACYKPVPESSVLTVGTPDYNGVPANSSGSLRIDVFCNGGGVGETAPCTTTAGDQLDGQITVSLTDVRCVGTSGGCSNGPLSDYTGNLRAVTQFRVIDKNNGPTGLGPSANATTQDVALGFYVPCNATGSTTVGATCSVVTSIDAILGGNTAVAEQKRAIWQMTAPAATSRSSMAAPTAWPRTWATTRCSRLPGCSSRNGPGHRGCRSPCARDSHPDPGRGPVRHGARLERHERGDLADRRRPRHDDPGRADRDHAVHARDGGLHAARREARRHPGRNRAFAIGLAIYGVGSLTTALSPT